MPPGAGYRERSPAPELRDRVECYWFFRSPIRPVDASRRILPDGCMDLLLDLGPHPGSGGPPAPATVVGTMTRALLVPPRPGADLVGVRFRPGGALPFLGAPARELVDLRVEADDLWRGSGTLVERMAEAPDEPGRIGLLDRFLLERLAADDPPAGDAVVLRAVERLVRSDAPPVGAVAEALGVSRRHLERGFARAVGLTPGVLRRVVRLRKATDLLAGDARLGLAGAAARAGYHDQPHMTRDFRELAGITPAAWLAERAARQAR